MVTMTETRPRHPNDNPQLVTDSIRDVVDAVRACKRLWCPDEETSELI
jgi:hypothetical protein